MAFASLQDVGDRLGRPLSSSEQDTVNLLLDTATAVVANAAGKDDAWAGALDPVPQILRALTIEVVCRAFANPSSLDSMQENLGAYSYVARFRAVGLLLTPDERRLIRREVDEDEFRVVTLETPYSGDTADSDIFVNDIPPP